MSTFMRGPRRLPGHSGQVRGRGKRLKAQGVLVSQFYQCCAVHAGRRESVPTTRTSVDLFRRAFNSGHRSLVLLVSGRTPKETGLVLHWHAFVVTLEETLYTLNLREAMDVLPEDNTGYSRRDYWDERYAKEDPAIAFDWCRRFVDVADHIHTFIPDKASRIVMLGCGHSTLSQDMYDDGYHNIANIDYSKICIEKMQELHSEARPDMTWQEGDIRHLPFSDESFDVAIDKATMDAMMATKGDVWNPPQKTVDNCNAEVDEVIRILKPGGLFLYITFGQPHFRKRYLTKPDTTLEVIELKTTGFSYFLYVMRKIAA